MEEAKDAYSTMQNAHIAPVEEAKGVFDAMASVERGESVEGEATASDGTSFTTAAKGKTTNNAEAETTDGAPSATSMEAAAAEMEGEVEAAGEALEEGEKEKGEKGEKGGRGGKAGGSSAAALADLEYALLRPHAVMEGSARELSTQDVALLQALL